MPAPRLKVFRTLRFRLAAAFLLLLTAVLAVVGFAGTRILKSILEDQSRDSVTEQIGSLKGGWINFDKKTGKPEWDVDHSDPEEEAEMTRLQAVYAIADDSGRLALSSEEPEIRKLFPTATVLAELERMRLTRQPILKTVTASNGVQYMILSSTMQDTKHGRRWWYVAEGRSLAEHSLILSQFRRNFLIFFPVALFACAVVSWFSARGALSALSSVQAAAGGITGSNLGLQIPKRGADDELDDLIESFNEMSRRLKRSFDQMRQFSTDVSHELRTPLTAIQGQLEVALFTAESEAALREAIENALQDVERLSNLVRALLLLSQSESGQIPMNRVTLDLHAMCREIVEQFQIPAEARNLSLHLEGEGPIWCEVDKVQMGRVVTNLLSNALKYTPDNGRIEVQVESRGMSVKLTVRDSGVGIPEDHLPNIFDRFYRVPDPNPEKGLGLGLSFVATIVKAHEGEIRVQSKVGSGTRFEIYLPASSRRAVRTEDVPKFVSR